MTAKQIHQMLESKQIKRAVVSFSWHKITCKCYFMWFFITSSVCEKSMFSLSLWHICSMNVYCVVEKLHVTFIFMFMITCSLPFKSGKFTEKLRHFSHGILKTWQTIFWLIISWMDETGRYTAYHIYINAMYYILEIYSAVDSLSYRYAHKHEHLLATFHKYVEFWDEMHCTFETNLASFAHLS